MQIGQDLILKGAFAGRQFFDRFSQRYFFDGLFEFERDYSMKDINGCDWKLTNSLILDKRMVDLTGKWPSGY